MSTTIDERVVEMRFDNKHFESNVATSMSTLDKLKQKLNLSGASKGLEDINAASRKVDMSGLGRSVETVTARFSALDIMGVTALANITNQAVNAGKKMVSALTVEPVKTGFNEYELKMDSVKTIMASTGESVEKVNGYLKELNEYSDQTIYSFKDMTQNIGKFTNAGVKLEDAVLAIKGISNEAALSGANANEASRAMYNFSQALSTGYIQRIDWKSIELANMATVEFKEQLLDSAIAMGTVEKNAEGMWRAVGDDKWYNTSQMFIETLDEQWLTSEVLIDTLKDYADGTTDIGKRAFAAAQDVTKFTQMWSILKETAQSGWAETWELIVGDIEQAKKLLTPITNFLSGIVDKMSDFRNTVIKSALGKGFSDISNSIKKLVTPAKKVSKTLEKTVDTISDLDEIVDKVILGKFGNGKERFDSLTEAGQNYYRIQNKVNESLGNSYRYSDELIEKQDELLGKQEKSNKTTSESTKETEKLTEAQKKQIIARAKLTDEELRGLNYSEDQITAFKELRTTADKLGLSIEDLVNNIDEINGRWLIIESFKNIWNSLLDIFEAIGEAWVKVFGPVDAEAIGESITDILGAFHKLTSEMTASEDTLKNITSIFEGFFSAFDVVRLLFGGTSLVFFKTINAILKAFDLNIIDVAAHVAELIVAFRNWLRGCNGVNVMFDWLITKVTGAIKRFDEWFELLTQTSAVQKLVGAIKTIGDAFNKLMSGELNISEFANALGYNLASALKSLPEIAVEIGKNVIAGFQNGISDGFSDVIKNIIDFCKNFIAGFMEALGEHSPSVIAYGIGAFFIAGFVKGLLDNNGDVIATLTSIADGVIKIFKGFWDFLTNENGNIDWGKIFAGGSLIALLVTLKKVVDIVGIFAEGIQSINGIINAAKGVLSSFSGVLKSVALDIKANAILKMAGAVAILVVALGAIVWMTEKTTIGKLWNAVGVLAAMALIVVGLAFAMNKLSGASVQLDAKSKSLKASGLQKSLLQIGLTLLTLAAAVKLVGEMGPDEIKQGLLAIAGMMVSLIAFVAIVERIPRYDADVEDIGGMMIKLGIAMGIMAFVMKMIGKMDPEDMIMGVIVMEAFVLLIAQIAIANRVAGEAGKNFGANVLKISFAMLLMVGVCKLAAMLSVGELFKGITFAFAFTLLIGILAKMTKVDRGQQIAKLSGLVLSVSASLLMMVGVCKLVGMLSVEEMVKGGLFVAAFTIFLKYLVGILKIGSEEQIAKVSGTILAMSIAIGVLAGVATILGFVPLKDLAKGIVAVGLLSLMMTVMIKQLKGATDAQGAIMMMAIAIGVMAAAVVALSFIPTKDLAAATASIGILMATFALMIKQLHGVNGVKIGPLISLTAAALVLTGLVTLLSFVNAENAVPNVIALSILALSLGGLVSALSKINVNLKGALKGVLALTTMVVPLVAFAVALHLLPDVSGAQKNILTLVTVMTAVTLLIAPLAAIGKLAGFNTLTGVLALTTMVVPLVAFALALHLLPDVSGAEKNIITLVTVMTAMSLLLVPLSLIGALAGFTALAGILALTAMVVPLAAFALALHLLPDVSGTQKNIMSLVTVMTAMTALLVPLTLIGIFAGAAVAGIAALTVFGAFILAFGGVATAVGWLMEKCPDLQTFLDIGIPVLEQLASGLGSVIGSFITGFSSEVMSTITEFGTCIKTLSDSVKDIDTDAVDGAKNVANMLLALTASEAITSLIEKFGVSTDFSTAGQSLKTFGEAVVGFSETISGKIDIAAVEAATNAGLLLVELNKSLPKSGGLFQDIVGEKDFGKFTSACAAFANCILSINTIVSQEGFKIESEKIEQLVVAGEAFNRLNTALPKTGGIAQDIAGEQDLAGFGKACAAFVNCMVAINDVLKQEGFKVESEKMDQLAAAGEAFNKLNTNLPKTGGIAQDLAGEKDLAGFGKACAAFANCMIDVNSALSQEGFAVNLDGMEQLKQAGLKMNELQDVLPKTGGWWQEVSGQQDIGDFGTKVRTFAEAIADFSTSSAELNQAGINTCISTAYRIKDLIESFIGIDYSGVDAFTGIGSGGIGADGPAYDIACAMSKFSNKVADINTEAVTVAVSSARSLKTLITSLVGLDTSGIENFKPGAIGDQMKAYSETVGNIDTGVVASSITSANRLKTFIASLVELDNSGISKFKVSSIGTSLKNYAASISSFDAGTVSGSITSANKLRNFIASLANLDTSGVSSFTTAIQKLSTVNINAVVKAFSGATTRFSSAGTDLINGLINGMESKASSLVTVSNEMITNSVEKIRSKQDAFYKAGTYLVTGFKNGISEDSSKAVDKAKAMANSAAQGTRDKYTAFYNAGSYLVTGFKNGISDNAYKAVAKAKAMAEAAEEAARKALGINSPSKVFKEIGSGIPEGFAMGIGMLGNSVKGSVTDMASGAIDSTRSAMTSVLELLNSDVNAQPTIRPVIDLSNARTGADAINDMFNGVRTVGVNSNLNAVNSMMRNKPQNGTDEVVSALNKLRKDVGNMERASYNINGITYDDGSAVSEAIKVLVREAKVGRRV